MVIDAVRNTLRRGTIETKLMYQTLQMLEATHQEDPSIFNDQAKEYIVAINRAYLKIAKNIDLHQAAAIEAVAQAISLMEAKRAQFQGGESS